MVREPGPNQVHPAVTVVVPTLAADETLAQCLDSLERQTFRDFEIVVVDNSGRGLVPPRDRVKVIANDRNVGFGAAVNQAVHASSAPFVAVLNDDALAHPGWVEALLAAVEDRPDVGLCSSQVILSRDGNGAGGRLDSAGMLLCRDGSSKQRGHLEPPKSYSRLQ